MKASLKKLLNKILNWSGFEITWDWRTDNTSDTWIPVFTGATIQHRVIPTNTRVNATRVGSVWTAGEIAAFRRGNCCVLKINGATFNGVNARTVFASLPEGFRPPTEVTLHIPRSPYTTIIGVRWDGQIWVENLDAGSYWYNLTYCV